jgi:hypothetical protein
MELSYNFPRNLLKEPIRVFVLGKPFHHNLTENPSSLRPFTIYKENEVLLIQSPKEFAQDKHNIVKELFGRFRSVFSSLAEKTNSIVKNLMPFAVNFCDRNDIVAF